MKLEKGKNIYWARCYESVNMFQLIDLKVVMVGKDFFTGTDKATHQTYIFDERDIGTTIFFTRGEALEVVKNKELNARDIVGERYYEEY